MLNRRNLRVKVLQLLYSYYNQSEHSSDLEELQRNLSKELSLSIKNIDKYFYDILSIVIVFMDINLEKKEIAKVEKIKKSPLRFNLSENPIIKFIKSNSSIIDGLISHNNKWDKKCDHLRDWYKILTEEEFYKDHISIENSNFEEDYSFFKTLILSFIIKNEEINKFFENLNVEPFGKKGDEMDPVIHDAMLTQADEDKENDIILDVFEKGYTYRDKVIRHAKVIVNKK